MDCFNPHQARRPDAPHEVPQEYGNRVKTDRRDSGKLAHLLAKGMLKRVWVPSEEELYHRQVIRRRRQILRDSPGRTARPMDPGLLRDPIAP